MKTLDALTFDQLDNVNGGRGIKATHKHQGSDFIPSGNAEFGLKVPDGKCGLHEVMGPDGQCIIPGNLG